jgi:transcriptional regulator with XRE-family HTH domain
MAQADPLITTLKKALKAQGLTYHAVAKGLGVSEASVKRYFSRKQFSLAQLERICQLLGMELSDLVRMMDAETRQLTELTEAQERELTSDIRLLLVAFLVVNGLTYQDLIRYYRLSETDTVRYLARLDRLRLIELFPQNRIKLLISPNFT